LAKKPLYSTGTGTNLGRKRTDDRGARQIEAIREGRLEITKEYQAGREAKSHFEMRGSIGLKKTCICHETGGGRRSRNPRRKLSVKRPSPIGGPSGMEAVMLLLEGFL